MLQKFVLLLSLFFFTTVISVCDAQKLVERKEGILNFISKITVNQDASTDVIEKITLYTEHNQIKEGFTRVLPLNYVDNFGRNHRLHYKVNQIVVNNKPVEYKLTEQANGLNLFIKNPLNEKGTFICTINYHTNGVMDFLKGADSFYWNVTGNDWKFPILYALAEVTLPHGSKITYSGSGSKEQNLSTSQPADNVIVFETNQPLSPGEDLSVALVFPKGIIHKPTLIAQARTFHASTFVLMGLVAVLLIYFFITLFLRHKERRRSRIFIL